MYLEEIPDDVRGLELFRVLADHEFRRLSDAARPVVAEAFDCDEDNFRAVASRTEAARAVPAFNDGDGTWRARV